LKAEVKIRGAALVLRFPGDKDMKDKPKILVVDDEERNLRLIEAMLMPLGYEIILAGSGKEALEKVRDTPPDVILLDIMMPEMDGFEVAKNLKDKEETKIIPIVMITVLKEAGDRVKALEVGADDFLTKPVERTELKARVQSLLKVKAYYDHMRSYEKNLEVDVDKRTKELQQALAELKAASIDTIYRLAEAAEYKDAGTGAHIKRMSNFAVAVARRMGLSDKTVEAILYAVPMHDIGKIGIPDQILLKPGKLDPNEWEIMKQHTIIGGRILSGSDAEFIKLAEIIALTHREKWDGSGYPKRLKGSEIPLAGRITAIADVFDALISKRPYKGPFPLEKVFDIIKEGRGSHFDPDFVDAFFDIKNEIVLIKETYKDQGKKLFFGMRKKS